MSKNLEVMCFFENARVEGKKIVMSCGNTYEDIDINKYNVKRNMLVVNGKKIRIKDVYESIDGYLMRVGEWELVMS